MSFSRTNESLTEMNHKKNNQFMQDNGGEWMSRTRNLPTASNMGGVWGRQIRSARRILESPLKTHGAIVSNKSVSALLV